MFDVWEIECYVTSETETFVDKIREMREKYESVFKLEEHDNHPFSLAEAINNTKVTAYNCFKRDLENALQDFKNSLEIDLSSYEY